MFNLEQAIADWRQQMLTAGVKSTEYLDELESHLRDDLEEMARSGLSGQEAFNAARRQIGRADILQKEFIKSGNTRRQHWLRLMANFAGIPNLQPATTMNTLQPTPNLEPRWATYFKAAAFALPAAFIWLFSMVFIMPKLQELCQAAGMALFTFKEAPAIFQAFAFVGQGLFALTHYGLFISAAILAAFGLLEWRTSGWPRYRRAVLGTGTFLLNVAVLISITLMVITAIVAVSKLHQIK